MSVFIIRAEWLKISPKQWKQWDFKGSLVFNRFNFILHIRWFHLSLCFFSCCFTFGVYELNNTECYLRISRQKSKSLKNRQDFSQSQLTDCCLSILNFRSSKLGPEAPSLEIAKTVITSQLFRGGNAVNSKTSCDMWENKARRGVLISKQKVGKREWGCISSHLPSQRTVQKCNSFFHD